jgi:hypothetical protein
VSKRWPTRKPLHPIREIEIKGAVQKGPGQPFTFLNGTLLTGQHHLVDPIGGVGLAFLAYDFGMWMEYGTERTDIPHITANTDAAEGNTVIFGMDVLRACHG